MIKRKRFLLASVLICISVLLLTGCNNSKDRMSELMSEFKETTKTEVTAWLSKNIPSAVLDEGSLRAYVDMNWVYEAVEGQYTNNGTSYKFMYAIESKQMYIEDERMVEICDELQSAFKEKFLYGIPQDRYSFRAEECYILYNVPCYGHKFSGDKADRTYDKNAVKAVGLPYGMTVEDFYRQDAAKQEYTVIINDEIVFNGQDSVKTLKLHRYNDPFDAEESSVWLYALSGKDSSYKISLYSKDLADKLTLRFCYSKSNMLQAEYSILRADEENMYYQLSETDNYRIDYDEECFTK